MSPRRPGRPHSGAWPRILLAGVTPLVGGDGRATTLTIPWLDPTGLGTFRRR